MTAELTITQFEELIGLAYGLRKEIDDLEKLQIKPRKETLDELEGKILDVLDHQGKTSYKSSHGTVIKTTRYSVLTPKTQEEKEALFNWLRGKGDGVYFKYVSVNSQSLNALCNEEKEIAKEEGRMDYLPPGVKEGETTIGLTFRKV